MKIKKLAGTAAAMAAVLAMTAMPAWAEDTDTTTTQSTQLSYVAQANEPSYTVTIPESLALSNDGTPLDITASDVADLNGKRVSVTLAGTNYYRNQMVLSAKTSKSSYTSVVRYQLISGEGNVLETTGKDTASGTELASFTDNGTVTYTVKPVIGVKGQNLEPGVSYTGTMTFGISLAE
jgi:hypothetical protein